MKEKVARMEMRRSQREEDLENLKRMGSKSECLVPSSEILVVEEPLEDVVLSFELEILFVI